MWFLSLVSFVLSLYLFLPDAAVAEVRLFSGKLSVVKYSGKACTDHKTIHRISLVIGNDSSEEAVFGYIGGDSVTVGQLYGKSYRSLNLRYPYPDTERADGHKVQIEISGKRLRGELRDRHLKQSDDGCNFDLAQMELELVENYEAATALYQRMSKLYGAKFAYSVALSVSPSATDAGVVHIFEKALALADELYPTGSPELLPYLTGLANSYIRFGRYQDFAILYNSRFTTVHDDAVKQMLNNHQIHFLIKAGRDAIALEDYHTALNNLRQALKINYKNRDAITLTFSALELSGQHNEAIGLLDKTDKKLAAEPNSKDVREVMALVEYKRAINIYKTGQLEEAESLIRRAIKLDPGSASYMVTLSRWIHKAGRFSEAESLLRRGLDSIKNKAQRKELIEARDKLRHTETILDRLSRIGN